MEENFNFQVIGTNCRQNILKAIINEDEQEEVKPFPCEAELIPLENKYEVRVDDLIVGFLSKDSITTKVKKKYPARIVSSWSSKYPGKKLDIKLKID